MSCKFHIDWFKFKAQISIGFDAQLSFRVTGKKKKKRKHPVPVMITTETTFEKGYMTNK